MGVRNGGLISANRSLHFFLNTKERSGVE